MSADQIELDTGVGPHAHLQKTKPENCASDFTTDKSREYWCGVCKHRVTISTDGFDEYGHGRDCPHLLEVDR